MTEKKRILLLYRTFGPSVNLCGLTQLEWLFNHGYVEFRHMPILHVGLEDLEWAQLVAFVRGDGLLDESLAWICHESGRTVLYILDDDLLNVPMELGSGPYYAQGSVKRHIHRLMEVSDCFFSPSPKLLELYCMKGKKSFRIIEPSVYQMRRKPVHTDGKIHIGFAGSSDRGSDIDHLLSDTLRTITAHYGNRVILEFFGIETAIAKELGCKTYPYTDSYEEYQKRMACLNWDIGLAPMPDTHFHSCKHYNKLIEYCGFGIAGVYSNLLPYTLGVEDGVTGILCDNTTQAWVGALSRLIEDDALRQQIQRECLDRAKRAFSVETAAKKLLDDLTGIETPEPGKVKVLCFPLMKLVGLSSWYCEKFKKYGWRTPVIAAKKLAMLLRRGGRTDESIGHRRSRTTWI